MTQPQGQDDLPRIPGVTYVETGPATAAKPRASTALILATVGFAFVTCVHLLFLAIFIWQGAPTGIAIEGVGSTVGIAATYAAARNTRSASALAVIFLLVTFTALGIGLNGFFGMFQEGGNI